MNKKEIVKEIGKKPLMVIGYIQGIFLLGLIASPFVFIWFGWLLALKIGMSGLIGVIITKLIYDGVENIIKSNINIKNKENEN